MLNSRWWLDSHLVVGRVTNWTASWMHAYFILGFIVHLTVVSSRTAMPHSWVLIGCRSYCHKGLHLLLNLISHGRLCSWIRRGSVTPLLFDILIICYSYLAKGLLTSIWHQKTSSLRHQGDQLLVSFLQIYASTHKCVCLLCSLPMHGFQLLQVKVHVPQNLEPLPQMLALVNHLPALLVPFLLLCGPLLF